MTRLRHGPAPERLVADIPVDERSALVIEQRNGRKLVIWRCPRYPAVETLLASADRAFSIPIRELGRVWPVFQRVDAETRLAIWSTQPQGVA